MHTTAHRCSNAACVRRPHHFKALTSALLLALASATSVATVAPQANAADTAMAIDLPAQPLADALRQVASAHRLQILFIEADVRGKQAPALRGNLTAVQALAMLLEGSGLLAVSNGKNTVAVRPKRSQGSAPIVTPDATLLAQAPPPPAQSAQDTQEEEDAAPRAGEVVEMERMVVTGSRLKRIEADSALPVNIYTKEDIERSGQPDVGRFLSTLNEVSMAFSGGEAGLGTVGRQSTVQLRGLPAGSTLVLINGRRVQPGSISTNAAVFNLNLIPVALVDRIEIVPVGSSAVYGGDALAGVVNIILKNTIEGITADARYGWADGTQDHSVSVGGGGGTDRASFMVFGTYSKTTPLYAAERDFLVNADYRRFGGVDRRVRFCTPGTVSSTTAGVNLPGLNSSFAGIPATPPDQALTIGDFTATAGQANLCGPSSNGNGVGLIYASEIAGLHSSADYRLSDSWSVFGELSFTSERFRSKEQGILLNDLLVPATNPYNPFGVDVRVTARLGRENGAETIDRKTDFTRAVLGLRGEVWPGWEANISLVSSHDKVVSKLFNFNFQSNAAAQAAALASSDPVTALNPFTTGRAASAEVLRGIYGDYVQRGKGKRDLASAVVTGSALDLPAGPLDVALGFELTREENLFQAPGQPDSVAERRVTAGFAEVRVPLFSSAVEQSPRFEWATLTLAGRNDRYSDFGSKSTYQAGLEIRPQRTLLLRAATATSFKPPTLVQLGFPAQGSFPLALFGLTDPARGGSLIATGNAFIGPNPNLRPETGKAKTIGAVWEPNFMSGLRVAVSDWQVELENMIGVANPQTLLNFEALFPGAVIRGTSVGGVPGPVQRLNLSFYNLGQLDVAGTDVNASLLFRTAAGTFSFNAGATHTRKYEVVIAPGAPTEDRLSRLSSEAWAPKWKTNLGAVWNQGLWTFNVAGRYLGSYKDSGASTRKLGDYWVTDLGAGIDLKKLRPNLIGGFRQASITLSVANIGNKLPEYADATPFYDITQGDWRGRYASLRLSASW
jgi:iron complex outermembrane receptor protein